MKVKHRHVYTSARADIWRALSMNRYNYTLPISSPYINISLKKVLRWHSKITFVKENCEYLHETRYMKEGTGERKINCLWNLCDVIRLCRSVIIYSANNKHWFIIFQLFSVKLIIIFKLESRKRPWAEKGVCPRIFFSYWVKSNIILLHCIAHK